MLAGLGEGWAYQLGPIAHCAGMLVSLPVGFARAADIIRGLFSVANPAEDLSVCQDRLAAQNIRQDVVYLAFANLERGLALLALAGGALQSFALGLS